MKATFLEVTGYSQNELLAWNPHTLLFLTTNGGKYHLKDDGTIEDLKGPPSDPEERIE